MLKATALAYFDGNVVRIARLLGISRKAVYAWPDVVPEGSAYKLQVKTKNGLRVDESLYPRTAAAS